MSKPTIVAVAGGFEIAYWCDMRISDETAVFGCCERRFGVPLVDGGPQRLPPIIRLGRALEMRLTRKPVSAREALASVFRILAAFFKKAAKIHISLFQTRPEHQGY